MRERDNNNFMSMPTLLSFCRRATRISLFPDQETELFFLVLLEVSRWILLIAFLRRLSPSPRLSENTRNG